jgi:monoterpene epsilon-lactone hydrolase
LRRKNVSVRGNLVREMMQNVMETSLKEPIRTGELRRNPVEPAWVCPAGYEYEIIENEHFNMEYLRPVGVFTGRVILQLHGGGYIGPMKNIYRRFAVRYSKISYGGDVLTPDYRVAPENPYPAALFDALAAYEWLINEKKYDPANIVIAGDSAGGGLGLALGLYLKDHNNPLPGGFISMSAWADLTNSGESYKTNYEIDPLFGNSTHNMLYDSSYLGEEDPKNPYISPMFGEFRQFPFVLLQVGSYEVLLSDTLSVAEKLKAAGVKYRLSVYDGMFHVFQMGLDLIPESQEAWEEAEEFLRIIYHISVKPDGKVVRKVQNGQRKTVRDVTKLLIAMMKKELNG